MKLRTCAQVYKANKNELTIPLQKRYIRVSQVYSKKTRNWNNLCGNIATANGNMKNMCQSVKCVRNFNIISKDVTN